MAVLLATLLVCADAANGQSMKPGGYVPGEVLVKYADGAGSASARKANNIADIIVSETLKDESWARVNLPAGIAVEEAIRDIAKLEGVVAVQPNFYYNLQLTPNDPSFNSTSMWGLFKISAPAAWDLTTGSSAVVVAVIDTGTRLTHQDLAPNLWTNAGEIPNNGVDDDGNGFVDDVYGWDFYHNRANVADEHGHGTHVAGTVGAAGNNALNVVGVNWTVKIMTIKIYNNTGFGSTSAMLVNAYAYVRMMKERGVNIRVTNNSYGGCDEACGYDQATKDGIDAMGDVGILNVFAAGNDNRNTDNLPAYPASYDSPSILSVASSTSADARSGFSNFGTNTVDLAAPGSGILSTTFASNTSSGNMSGTSMASPHVAGAAALLSALNPSLSAPSLKATLMNQVDALPAWTTLVKTGGRLNVDKALRDQTQCQLLPPADPMRIPTKGGVYTFNFTAGANCDYRVKSNVSWIKMMGETDHSGDGSVTFRIPVNPVISRTGTIVIGGRPMTIVQARN